MPFGSEMLEGRVENFSCEFLHHVRRAFLLTSCLHTCRVTSAAIDRTHFVLRIDRHSWGPASRALYPLLVTVVASRVWHPGTFPRPMKLLTWNIRHGGGTRLAHIVEELAAFDADVIALTEYRVQPGRELRAELIERAWPSVETTEPTGSGFEQDAPVEHREAAEHLSAGACRPCPTPPPTSA